MTLKHAYQTIFCKLLHFPLKFFNDVETNEVATEDLQYYLAHTERPIFDIVHPTHTRLNGFDGEHIEPCHQLGRRFCTKHASDRLKSDFSGLLIIPTCVLSERIVFEGFSDAMRHVNAFSQGKRCLQRKLINEQI